MDGLSACSGRRQHEYSGIHLSGGLVLSPWPDHYPKSDPPRNLAASDRRPQGRPGCKIGDRRQPFDLLAPRLAIFNLGVVSTRTSIAATEIGRAGGDE